jgi:membrane protein CcdC involved in cytochrome C biogenesis
MGRLDKVIVFRVLIMRMIMNCDSVVILLQELGRPIFPDEAILGPIHMRWSAYFIVVAFEQQTATHFVLFILRLFLLCENTNHAKFHVISST